MRSRWNAKTCIIVLLLTERSTIEQLFCKKTYVHGNNSLLIICYIKFLLKINSVTCVYRFVYLYKHLLYFNFMGFMILPCKLVHVRINWDWCILLNMCQLYLSVCLSVYVPRRISCWRSGITRTTEPILLEYRLRMGFYYEFCWGKENYNTF